MKTRYTLFLLLLLIGLTQTLFAQRQADNWFFGLQASLEFTSNTPSSFYNSAMQAPEGSATISDKNGNLLFYTDGQTIWNRLHMTMANGTGLSGNSGSTQSSLIVPQPGNDSLFYLFTTDVNVGGFSANGLRYSIVNINANNGMGEVRPNSKNISLTGAAPSSLSEKLAGVHHFNNQDVWVMTHRFGTAGTQEFLAYKVTAAGLTTTPVISTLPAMTTQTGKGYLKFAPTGNKIAACFANIGFQIYDFDNKTGVVSNPQTLFDNLRPIDSYYGAEFSPDGTKLYVSVNLSTTTFQLWQYNLSAGPLSAIIASRTTLSNMGGFGAGNYKALQVARNGKIYVSRSNTSFLSEIANPNSAGAAANFKASAVLPNNSLAIGSLHGFGFPNFIQSYFAPPRFNYTGICAESPTVFSIVNTAGIDSVRWNFDDPGTISPNTSTQLQASHTYFFPGTYAVKLIVYTQGMQQLFERQVTILNKPKVNLGPDTTICEGKPFNLASSFPLSPFNERFLWSTGDTVAAITVTAPGIYWLELNNGQCTTRDSIRIRTRKPPEVDLGPDFYTCGNGTVTLDAGNPGATYLWQPGGETTQIITVTASGSYKVTVTSNGCSATDTKNVTILSYSGIELGGDITVCEGEVVTIDPNIFTGTGVYVLWSDSTTGTTMQVTKSGKYWVRLMKSGCLFSDTIRVNFKPCPPPPIPVIPNIITPNGDNLNEKLVMGNIPEGAWHLKIFNRWGMLVYEKKNYRNEWPKEKVTDGNYYYLLEDPDTGRLFKGWVEVVQ